MKLLNVWVVRQSLNNDLVTLLQVDPDAFKAVVHFLYTGRLNTPASILDDCIRLAEQFQLPQLEQLLEAEKKMLTSSGNYTHQYRDRAFYW
jgi:BTB/POZ domain